MFNLLGNLFFTGNSSMGRFLKKMGERFHSYEFINMLLQRENKFLNEINKGIKVEEEVLMSTFLNFDYESIYRKTLQQNCEFWKTCRKFRITGSNAYSFYTASLKEDINWDEKLQTHFNKSFSGNVATEHGKKYEDSARCEYSKNESAIKNCGFIINKLVPYLGFSPDGIDEEGNLIEIKCPLIGAKYNINNVVKEMTYLKYLNNEYTLKEKHAYFGQIQLGLGLLNLQNCNLILFASFDNSYKVIKVPYDPIFCENFFLRLSSLYLNVVLPYICNKSCKQ